MIDHLTMKISADPAGRTDAAFPSQYPLLRYDETPDHLEQSLSRFASRMNGINERSRGKWISRQCPLRLTLGIPRQMRNLKNHWKSKACSIVIRSCNKGKSRLRSSRA